jgi:hypothetical protein
MHGLHKLNDEVSNIKTGKHFRLPSWRDQQDVILMMEQIQTQTLMMLQTQVSCRISMLSGVLVQCQFQDR